MRAEKKRYGLYGDYEIASSVSMACFWPVTTDLDEALAAFTERPLLAGFCLSPNGRSRQKTAKSGRPTASPSLKDQPSDIPRLGLMHDTNRQSQDAILNL